MFDLFDINCHHHFILLDRLCEMLANETSSYGQFIVESNWTFVPVVHGNGTDLRPWWSWPSTAKFQTIDPWVKVDIFAKFEEIPLAVFVQNCFYENGMDWWKDKLNTWSFFKFQGTEMKRVRGIVFSQILIMFLGVTWVVTLRAAEGGRIRWQAWLDNRYVRGFRNVGGGIKTQRSGHWALHFRSTAVCVTGKNRILALMKEVRSCTLFLP